MLGSRHVGSSTYLVQHLWSDTNDKDLFWRIVKEWSNDRQWNDGLSLGSKVNFLPTN